MTLGKTYNLCEAYFHNEVIRWMPLVLQYGQELIDSKDKNIDDIMGWCCEKQFFNLFRVYY